VVVFAPADNGGGEPSGPVLVASGMAVENLVLAFHAQGLASRWVPAASREDAIRAALGIAEGWHPTGIVAVGRTAPGTASPRPPQGLARVVER
jgi:nitroreductase